MHATDDLTPEPGPLPASDPQPMTALDGEAAPPPVSPPPGATTAALGAPARDRAWRRPIAVVLAASLLSAGLASTATSLLDSAASSAAAPVAASGTAISATTAVAASTASSIVSAAARVSPAVVTITIGASSAGGPFASAGGTGSGFIYDSNGLILTNAHVVESGGAITVTLADGRSFAGTVVASDSAADLAVVRVDATGLPAVTLGSPAGLAVGSTVIAIGDPLGEYPGSVTIGVVSGLDRGITVMDGQTRTAHDLAGLIQTDAAVNEGNSGGPLVTVDGKVIGIVAAGSSSAQGIGFAIPIDRAAAIMAQAGGAAVQG